MKKGITPIIAVIILLLITVALAGMAWVFMSGYFTGMTAKNIQLIDYSCAGGTARVVFRNAGTSTITLVNGPCTGSFPGNVVTCGELTVVKTSGTFAAAPSTDKDSIASTPTAEIATFTDNCGSGNTCIYRLTTTTGAAGPSPNVDTVNC
ncbi:MAG: archaellin/type IV pilin N-terminal domain-containing protein [Candidatus Aenigmatarchaeota archaeon]